MSEQEARAWCGNMGGTTLMALVAFLFGLASGGTWLLALTSFWFLFCVFLFGYSLGRYAAWGIKP